MNPYLLVVAVIIYAVGIASGIKFEGNKRDAAELRSVQVQAQAFHQEFEVQRKTAGEIGAALAIERQKAATDRNGFNRKLTEAKRANTLGKCEPDKSPTTVGAVRYRQYVNAGMWNDALQIGRAASRDNPPGTDGASAGPRFTPIDDAYDNLGVNAESWALCRSTLRKWQALAMRNGWASAAPAPAIPDSTSPGAAPSLKTGTPNGKTQGLGLKNLFNFGR